MTMNNQLRRKGTLTGSALCVVAFALLGTAPANAAPAPRGDKISLTALSTIQPALTNTTFEDFVVPGPNGEAVAIEWGFDYNPANHDHLRAYAIMAPSDGGIHTQADALNLGDNNGVLETASVNSPSGGFLLETAAVGCHKPNGQYNSNLHYSIRWSNGALLANQQTGELPVHDASVICF